MVNNVLQSYICINVCLQYNRLEYLPDELFMLPGLVTLDVSNNKLSALPFKMWRAPKLKELNASFNLLKDLPTLQPDVNKYFPVYYVTLVLKCFSLFLGNACKVHVVVCVLGYIIYHCTSPLLVHFY